MNDSVLRAMRDLIQQDVNHRGLATDPTANLLNACPDDFAAACRSIADTSHPNLGVVTGFYIAHANPPCGETDGPLGALFLARALSPLGVRVTLITEGFCEPALHAGLEACGLHHASPLVTLPPAAHPREVFRSGEWRPTFRGSLPLTHLIALERVGPSHTEQSLHSQPGCTKETLERFRAESPTASRDRCHSMRGRDITEFMSPAHRLFENASLPPPIVTIGVGDGGNEIGMGKVPWDVIRRNVPNGGQIACRVPTDHLIVCGVSNWGAYALAAGVALLRGDKLDPAVFDEDHERELLRVMVEKGPLVDGPTGLPTVSVDGLAFEDYVKPLRQLRDLLRC
jgi:D-glutamate cyclase